MWHVPSREHTEKDQHYGAIYTIFSPSVQDWYKNVTNMHFLQISPTVLVLSPVTVTVTYYHLYLAALIKQQNMPGCMIYKEQKNLLLVLCDISSHECKSEAMVC